MNTKNFTVLALIAAIGCGSDGQAPMAGDKGATLDGSGKEDRWNRINDPRRFRDGGQFNYHIADMPLEGTMDGEAWPSSYWPTYEDSINHRWARTGGELELSPAEKYDIAFNGWTPPEGFDDLRPFSRNNPVPEEDWDPSYYDNLGPLANHVSSRMGNGRDRQLALSNADLPVDEWDELPTETWWGLCHAWVPAALLEDRPERTVTYNGVDFHVGDVEALLIAAYNRAPADMIGGRCNVGNGDEEVERDEHGRPVDVECRDTNPGALHVIVTNFLGGQGRGFAMDRTFDYEVWNQPVVGYEITKQDEISVERANELLSVMGSEYIYNDDAETLYEVNMSLKWITESHAGKDPASQAQYTRTDYYRYILEVDADGEVIGGEYIDSNRFPDFLWNPRQRTTSSVPNLNLDNIRMLVELSQQPDMPDPGTGGMEVAQGEGNVAIPDNDSAGASSVATISGAAGSVTAVTVDLDLSHTYIGDLTVTLTKDGETQTLHNRAGGSDDDIRDAFMVPGFAGADPNGTWTLHVVDGASRDVGTINSWTLTVHTDEEGEPTDPVEPMVRRFEGAGDISIPDNDSAGITSTASVQGVTSGAVSIQVDITHTWRGDLHVEIEHNGRSWEIFSREGRSADDLHEVFPLDKTGDAFQGDPSGTWTLTVSDNAGQDLGTLDGWAVLVQ